MQFKVLNHRLTRKPTTKFWIRKAVEQRPCQQNVENNNISDNIPNGSSNRKFTTQ
jgi:hypothetical protein